MAGTKAKAALQAAVQDLLYMSESDEPFEVVSWKGPKGPLAPAELLKLAGHLPDTAG